MKNEYRKYPKDKDCPCGSGKKYSECCIDRDFQWVINKEDFVSRIINLSNFPKQLLEGQRAEQERVSRGVDLENDLVFPELQNISDKEYKYMVIKMMEQINVPKSYIYAYERTDVSTIPGCEKKLMKCDYIKWKEAVDEYEQKNGVEEENIRLPIVEINESLLYYLTEIVNNYASKKLNSNRNDITSKEYLGFLFSKILGFSKSIHILENNFRPYDALLMVRGIYECYLTINWFILCPNESNLWLEANQNLGEKGYCYQQKADGNYNYNVIINNKNEKIEKNLRFREMAKIASISNDNELNIFDILYSYLSSYIHPNVTSFWSFNNGRKFSIANQECSGEAVIISTFLLTLVMDKTKKIYKIPAKMKTKVASIKKELRNLFIDVVSKTNQTSDLMEYMIMLLDIS